MVSFHFAPPIFVPSICAGATSFCKFCSIYFTLCAPLYLDYCYLFVNRLRSLHRLSKADYQIFIIDYPFGQQAPCVCVCVCVCAQRPVITVDANRQTSPECATDAVAIATPGTAPDATVSLPVLNYTRSHAISCCNDGNTRYLASSGTY